MHKFKVSTLLPDDEGAWDRGGVANILNNESHVDSGFLSAMGLSFKDCEGIKERIQRNVMTDEETI